MRLVAGAVCAAAALVAVAGCSAVPGTAAEESDAITSFGDAIQEMPGVASVAFTDGDIAGLLDLTVELEPDVSSADAQEIGVASSRFALTELPPGTYAGDVELHQDASRYSYFSAPDEAAIREQVGYWLALANSGVGSASVATYRPPVQSTPAPEGATASGQPVIVNSPTGRYVGLTFTDPDDPDAVAEQLDAVRAVEDPGAGAGRWALEGLAPQSVAEFVQAGMPDAESIDVASSIASAVGDLDDRGSMRITTDAEDPEPWTSVEITSFDDKLEGASGAEAEATFRETSVWGALGPVVRTLAASGHDFSVSVVSNALEDSGNFHLGVGVDDCAYNGDGSWPRLGDELRDEWVAGTGAADEAGAQSACLTARGA